MASPEDNTAENKLVSLAYNQLYREVDGAVDAAIEEKKEEFRHPKGDGTFFGDLWAWIKGFIFQIAETFGFDGWLAERFDKHIPNEQETTGLKQQVTKSTAIALTAKDADGKFLATSMQPDELVDAVSKQVGADLKANKTLAQAFSAEQIAQIAKDTGADIKKNIGKIVTSLKSLQPDNTPPAKIEMTGKTADENVRLVLGQMTDKLFSISVVQDQIQGKEAQVAKIKPELINIAAELIQRDKNLLDLKDPSKFTSALIGELQNRKTFDAMGVKLDDVEVKDNIDLVLKPLVQKFQPDLLSAANGTPVSAAPSTPAPSTPAADAPQKPADPAAPTPASAAAAAPDTHKADTEKQLSNIQATLAGKIAKQFKEGIIVEAAGQVLAKYSIPENIGPVDFGVAQGKQIAMATNMTPEQSQAAQTLDRLYKQYHVDASKLEKLDMSKVAAEDVPVIKTAREKLYSYAAAKHKIFDEKQLDAASEIVGQSMVKTLGKPENRSISQTDLAKKVAEDIEASLKGSAKNINKLNPKNTIQILNKPLLFGSEGDILKNIADGIGKKICDDKAMYNMLKFGQEQLSEVTVSSVGKINGIIPGSVMGEHDASFGADNIVSAQRYKAAPPAQTSQYLLG